jgi:hypothetical protein
LLCWGHICACRRASSTYKWFKDTCVWRARVRSGATRSDQSAWLSIMEDTRSVV